jgi:transposase
LQTWRWRELVKALSALRGVRWLTAMTLVAEVGDLTRFDSPRQLMAYLGLVPSEHSSGGTRRQGGLTKTGNTLARKSLVESAWAYQYPAHKTAHMRAKMVGVSAPVEAMAWAAQRRLCARYKKLCEAGKSRPLACAAVAREMQGMAHGTRVS